jgi:hypothetical protein
MPPAQPAQSAQPAQAGSMASREDDISLKKFMDNFYLILSK